MATAPPATVFQYEPLPDPTWIRLITIHPDLDSDEIHVTLRSFDTKSCPEYVALSYVWGDSTPRETIYINGKRRMIHQNLWDFFYRSWQKQTTDFIWTDLICLDQNNHRERDEQVQRMGDIYSRAHHTLAWLGTNAWTAYEIQKSTERYAAGIGIIDSERVSPRRYLKALMYPRERQRTRPGEFLSILLNREYWVRAWIFQEIVCAKECLVVWGGREIWFEDLVRRMREVSGQQYGDEKPAVVSQHWFFKVAELRDDLKCNRRIEFLELVAMLSSGISTRQVDRIYGLLGLASRFDPDFGPHVLKVDYDKSLDDIFWELACLATGTRHLSKNSGFLGSMNIMNEREGTMVGTILSVGADLERYSKAAATPERWKSRTRVAHKVYQILASAYIHTCVKIKRRFDIGAVVRICDAWTAAVQYAMDEVSRLHTRPASLLLRKQALELGLSVFACTMDINEYAYEGIPSHSPGSPIWLCPAHLPQHVAAEAVEVIPFSFHRSYTAATLDLKCAAHSRHCMYSTLSTEVPGEGLVLQLQDLKLTLMRKMIWTGANLSRLKRSAAGLAKAKKPTLQRDDYYQLESLPTSSRAKTWHGYSPRDAALYDNLQGAGRSLVNSFLSFD